MQVPGQLVLVKAGSGTVYAFRGSVGGAASWLQTGWGEIANADRGTATQRSQANAALASAIGRPPSSVLRDAGVSTAVYDAAHPSGSQIDAGQPKQALKDAFALLSAPTPSLDTLLRKIEGELLGSAGSPPPPPKQQLYTFSFGTLGLGFDWVTGDPPRSLHQAVAIQSGTGCGTDPVAAQWQITWTSTNPGGSQTETEPYSFVLGGNPLAFAMYTFSDGSNLTLKLQVVPGSSPSITASETHAGNVQNVALSPQQAAITSTPVGAC
jgi:hypothetical protein